MKKFCVVISRIIRKEVRISAESESQAIEKVRQLYESGEVTFSSKMNERVNFHAKY